MSVPRTQRKRRGARPYRFGAGANRRLRPHPGGPCGRRHVAPDRCPFVETADGVEPA